MIGSNCPSSSDEISEALVYGVRAAACPRCGSIGLGNIWNPEIVLPNDVVATIVNASLQTLSIPVKIYLAGDYNHDLDRRLARLHALADGFGSVTTPAADGNFDGIVDAADYTVWRDNFGNSIAGVGYGNLGSGQSNGGVVGGAVPEPTGICWLYWPAAACWHLRRRPSSRTSV